MQFIHQTSNSNGQTDKGELTTLHGAMILSLWGGEKVFTVLAVDSSYRVVSHQVGDDDAKATTCEDRETLFDLLTTGTGDTALRSLLSTLVASELALD